MIKKIIPALMFCWACQTVPTENTAVENVDTTPALPELSDADKAEIRSLIESVTPPVEMTYVFNDLNLQFSSLVLQDPDHVKNYSTEMEHATALGIYSTDMLYCMAYGRNDLAEKYAAVLKELSVKLQIDQVLDVDKLKTMLESAEDVDATTMKLTVEIEKVHNYLEQNDQLHLSGMISFGSWVESMYIGSVISKGVDTYNEEMVNVLYFETQVAQKFIEFFEKYQVPPGYDVSMTNLRELESAYTAFQVEMEKVTPKVTYGEDKTEVVNVSKQHLVYNEDQLQNLMAQIDKLRKDISR